MPATILQPPVGGLHRSAAWQAQPPYTTPHCLNVCPIDPRSGRAQLGTRPGLTRFGYEAISPAVAVNMLARVDIPYDSTPQTAQRFIEDKVDGLFGVDGAPDYWSAFNSAPQADTIQRVHYIDGDDETPAAVGYVADDLNALSTSDMQLDLLAVPWRGRHDAVYTLYLHLDDSSPNPASRGIRVDFTLRTNAAGSDAITIAIYQHGSLLTTATSAPPGCDARMLRINFGASSTTLTVTYPSSSGGSAAFSQTSVTTPTLSAPTSTETRAAWRIAPAMGHRAQVGYVRLLYFIDSSAAISGGRIVCAANGTVRRCGSNGGLTSSSGLTVNAGVPIQTAQRLGTLYIADHGGALVSLTTSRGRASTTNPAPAGSHILISDSAGSTNFVTAGVTTSHIVEITDIGAGLGSTNMTTGVYAISAVSPSQVVLTRTTNAGVLASTAIAFNIRRSLKTYTPSTNVVSQIDTTSDVDSTNALGSPPAACRMIAEYRDRLVLADGNNWYMSRQGTMTDWAYGANPNDPGKAIAGTVAEAGKPPTEITALIAWRDDMMIFGTASRVFRLRGDPAYGGTLLPVSGDPVGIVGPAAWCVLPSGELYFLARIGLYRMLGEGAPEPVSAQLPHELSNIDAGKHAQMLHDPQENRIYIFLSADERGGGTKRVHWMYDLNFGGFWPFTLPQNFDPLSTVRSNGFFTTLQQVVMGGRDGTLRVFDRHARTDEGNDIASFAVLGPLRGAAAIDVDAGLDQISAACGEESEDCTLRVFAGRTPEAALRSAARNSDPPWSGTLTRGLNTGKYPRVRGQAFCLRAAAAAGQWSLHETQILLRQLGRTL